MNRPQIAPPRLAVLAAAFASLFAVGSRPAHAAPSSLKYTAIGDSVTVGLYADTNAGPPEAAAPLQDGTFAHGFAAQVRDELIATRNYTLADYHNRAVSGATSSATLNGGSAALAVFPTQVTAANADAPDLVTITVGGNDVKNYLLAQGGPTVGGQADPKVVTFKGLFQPGIQGIFSGLRTGAPKRALFATNVPKLWLLPAVYSFGQAPTSDPLVIAARQAFAQTQLTDYVTAANAVFAAEAPTYGVTIIDIYNDDTITNPAVVSPIDGFHPSRTGHDALAAKFITAMSGVKELPSLLVDTLADDSTDTDGKTSLREAIGYANSGASRQYRVRFNNPANQINITGTGSGGTTVGISAPQDGVISMDVQGTSGTYMLKAGANSTGPISFNASAAAVGASLNGLPSISATGSVAVSAVSTITFSNLSGAITLGSALPDLNADIEVRGPGAKVLAVSGGSKVRPFNILAGKTVTIAGLTLKNGKASSGGAIFNQGTLVLNACALAGSAATYGGALFNDYTTPSIATVTGCTFSGNSTAPTGGNPDFGGAIFNGGTLTVNNSTFSGNSSGGGGAISNNAGTTQLNNSTVTENSAGAIISPITGTGLTLNNTIVAGNGSSDFGSGASVVGGNCNLIGTVGGATFTGTGNQTGVTNPGLAPLADNGGPTATHALLDGSPALDAGDPAVTGIGQTHQRGAGFPRVVHNRLDIGAFEANVLIVTLVPGSPTSVSETAGAAATTLRVTRFGNTVGSLTVALRVPTGPRLKAPSAVVIPNGVAFKDFPVNAINTSFSEGTENYIVRATAPGTANVFDPAGVVQVTDDEAPTPALTATLTPDAFTEGTKSSVTLTVTHNRGAKSPAVVVNLDSADTRFQLPASITIPANNRAKSIKIPFVADAINSGTVDSTIELSAGGFTGTTVHATIYDSLAQLTIGVASGFSSAFSENAGPIGTKLRITRNTPTGQHVDLKFTVKAGATQVTVPATATFAHGQSFVDIDVAPVNDLVVDGTQRVVVEVRAAGFVAVKGINLYVYDDDAPAPIAAPAVSTVALSSVTADAAKGTVTLTFTGALGASAGDAGHYGVAVAGQDLPVTAASRKGNNAVELTADGLAGGAAVTVTYDIADATGRTLKGSGKTVAK